MPSLIFLIKITHEVKVTSTVSQRGINYRIFYISSTHTETTGRGDVRRQTGYWRETETGNKDEEWS